MIVQMIVWSNLYLGVVLVLFSPALFIYLWTVACNKLALGYPLLNSLCFPYLVHEVLSDHLYPELFWHICVCFWLFLYLLWLLISFPNRNTMYYLDHDLPILSLSVITDLLGFLILLRVRSFYWLFNE